MDLSLSRRAAAGPLGGPARRLVLAAVLALPVPAAASAPGEPGGMALESECVLTLRGGLTIRAQVLQYVPGSHVFLRAFDGQTFRLPIEQVLEIRHPGSGPLPPSPACVRIPRPPRRAPVDASPEPRPPAPESAPAADDEPARLAAGSPAAARADNASGTPVTLVTSEPAAELHQATGVSQTQSRYRGRTTSSWEYVWKTVCKNPCNLHLAEEGIYRVGGEGFRPSAPFRLDELSRGPFALQVRLGSTRVYGGGVASAVAGVLSSIAGAVVLIGAATSAPQVPPLGAPSSYLIDYQRAQSFQRDLLTLGGVLVGTGIVGIVAGALLIRHGQTRVSIERPSPPDEPSPP